MNLLLDTDTIDGTVRVFLSTIGDIFAVFDRTEHSGNVSYGVTVDGQRYFVKTAGTTRSSCFSLDERLALLRTAIDMARDIDHPALTKLLKVLDTATEGPVLVYEWVNGEILDVPRDERENPM